MKKIKKNLKNFYKKIIQVFFKFLYGDIKGKISHSDSKDIVLIELEIDKNNYKIYNCKDCSLYTDTIHNTAIIKKGKIVKVWDNVKVKDHAREVLETLKSLK